MVQKGEGEIFRCTSLEGDRKYEAPERCRLGCDKGCVT